MRRAVILGLSPFIHDYYRKDPKLLFDEVGGNTGNLAFQLAVASQITGPQATGHWNMEPQALRERADVIVLPLANQLGPHTDLGAAADKLTAFDLPVVGIGLGAQANSDSEDVELTDGTVRWLQTIARLSASGAPNIGVRGAYTKAQIGRFGAEAACAITGCPSNFINTMDDIAASVAAGFQRKPALVAVNAGIPHAPKLRDIEIALAKIVTDTGGAYIVQHGLEMIRLARNDFAAMKPETLELCRDYIMPEAGMADFQLWCRRFAIAFFDARSWMDYVRRFDFVVGTRFHGAMLAIQAGVPAACIAHDSRTYEMCTTMGIPVRHSAEIDGPLNAGNLLDLFSFDADAYRQKRADLLSAYRGIMQAAGIDMHPRLKKM